ncbi:MAG: ABC transporter ATP-binding protein [Aggregatilineales bacterium]
MMLNRDQRLFGQETKKARSIRVTAGRFAQYFKDYPAGAIIAILLVFVSAWTAAIVPELVGQAVDCYLFPQPITDTCWYTEIPQEWYQPNPDQAQQDARIQGVVGLVALLAGVFVLGSVVTGISFHAMRWSGQNVIRAMQKDLFAHIHRLTMGYYARNEVGDVMSRVTNDVDSIQQAFNFALINVFSSIVTVIWIMIRMIQTDVPYALLSLAIIPVMLLTTSFFSNQARKAFRNVREELGSVNSDLQESISGAREVQAFNREEESIAQFTESNEANRAANIRAAMWTSALRPVLEALGYVSIAIVVVVGGLGLLGQLTFLPAASLTLGTVFAFVGYTQRINQPVQQIAILWTNLQNAIAGGERIFDLIDEQPDMEDKADAIAMPQIDGHVVVENASMEYIKGEPVLRNLSFEAKTGEMIAFVGHTGAGKTSLINLIPRFYDVTTGSVKIDGHDVRDVTRNSLREQIGIVLQDTFLFSDSVMDNIRYGRLGATDEEVIEAAKMVAAHDFIERLPEGYETVLGERGSGLSQGQRQLIAIARVALMNPRILILDEATSSVDTRTERVIQAAFEKLLEGRTSFVIAHRLSTIRDANQVIMLDQGEIIERGDHQTLLAEEGAYYDLYMSQFRAEDAPGI